MTISRPEFSALERHRRELTAYCYRMLGSPFEAEDAVQETLLRGWRALDRFEGRAQLRSWLYKIATNVCLDMLDGRRRRARPVDLGPARSPDGPVGDQRAAIEWIEPIPDGLVTAPEDDPAELASARETLRLALRRSGLRRSRGVIESMIAICRLRIFSSRPAFAI